MNEDTTKATSDSPSFFRSGVREPIVPTPGLESGKIVGDFELLSQLGQGGMGLGQASNAARSFVTSGLADC